MRTTERNRNKTRDLAFIALFAVLIAVCSWISIPMVIPFTMQTFAVFFALNFLGGRNGIAAVCVYLLLGMVGLPVFSNGTGGIGVLLGNTGGYMIGWIFAGLVMWLLEKILGRKLWVQAFSMLAGLLVCYVFGTVWFMTVYARNTGAIGLGAALGWSVFPFVIPDLLKLGLALWFSRRFERILQVI